MADNLIPPTYVEGWHLAPPGQGPSPLKYKRFGATSMIVSELSFGGAHLRPGDQIAAQTLESALRKGVNYIDTAPYYGLGQAEIALGQALKNIPRQAYYLATKVSRTSGAEFDFTHDATLKMVENSLKTLGVDHIDLIQVHDVEFAPTLDIVLNETLPALYSLRRAGKVRHIGVTGYPIEPLKELVERSHVKIDAILSYCRYTLFDRSLDSFLPFFTEKQVGIINAAPVGMGLLTNMPAPDWHPAGSELKDLCTQVAAHCESQGVRISRLALAFALSEKRIHTTLVGMKDFDTLDENLNAVLQPLSVKEQQVQAKIQEKIAQSQVKGHWEGVELDRYRRDPIEFRNYFLGAQNAKK